MKRSLIRNKGEEWKTIVIENHSRMHLDISVFSDLCPVHSDAEEERSSLYGKLSTFLCSGCRNGITLVSLVRVMQQDRNRFCCFPFIALITPRGVSSTTYHPHPPTSNHSSISFSTFASLIFSVLTIR